MSSNPKRPSSRPSRGARPETRAVLQADDPRPQRVPQLPASPSTRKSRRVEEHIPTSVYKSNPKRDEELEPSYDLKEISDPGFAPAFLYIDKGPGAGQLFNLRQGALILGRASVSDVRLQHPSISRRHAQISRKGDRFYVRDLGSQNGTYANKQRVEAEIEIFIGDVVTIGSAQIKLRGPTQSPMSSETEAQPSRRSKKPANSLAQVALFGLFAGLGVAGVLLAGLYFTRQQRAAPAPIAVVRTAPAPVAAPVVESPIVEASDITASPEVDARIREVMQQTAPREPVVPPTAPASAPRAPIRSATKDSITPAQQNRLLSAVEEAQAAYDSGRGADAIKAYERALAADRDVNPRGSEFTPTIKNRLSELYTKVGAAHLAQGNNDGARLAFLAAVKNNPKNGQAQGELKKLAPQAATKSRQQAIDDAFGD